MPDRFVDPYVDPETGVLRNLVGARSYDDLARAEGEFASLRMGELIERGNLRPTGTLEDFRSIHRVLFQDIYAWAVKSAQLRYARTWTVRSSFCRRPASPWEWNGRALSSWATICSRGSDCSVFPNALRIITTTTTLSTRLERATAGRSVYFGRCSVTMPGTTWTGGLYPARRTTRPVDSLPRIGTTRCSLACSPGLPHRAIRRCPSIEGSWRPITCTKADATCPPWSSSAHEGVGHCSS